MKVHVHVKEKTVSVECGEGTQKVLWLAHVGIARYDSNFGLELGIPQGVKTDQESELELTAQVKDKVDDGQHVWVILKDDIHNENQ